MSQDARIEIAARAIARQRLSGSELTSKLASDLARGIHERAIEQLWPQLVDEARAVIEALDGAGGGSSPKA